MIAKKQPAANLLAVILNSLVMLWCVPAAIAEGTGPHAPEVQSELQPSAQTGEAESKPAAVQPENVVQSETKRAAVTPARQRDDLVPLGKPANATQAIEAQNITNQNNPAQATAAPMITSAAALFAVIGAILVLGWITRKFIPTSSLMLAMGKHGKAPSGVLEVLGRYPFSRQSTLVLLKLDRRILLINQTKNAALVTLCEITDPDQVASIISKSGGDASFVASLTKATSVQSTPVASRNISASESNPRSAVAAQVVKSSASAVSPVNTTQHNSARFEPSTQDGASAAAALRLRYAQMRRAANQDSELTQAMVTKPSDARSTHELISPSRGSSILPTGLAA